RRRVLDSGAGAAGRRPPRRPAPHHAAGRSRPDEARGQEKDGRPRSEAADARHPPILPLARDDAASAAREFDRAAPGIGTAEPAMLSLAGGGRMRPPSDDGGSSMPAPAALQRAATLGLKVTAALAFVAPLLARI